jgi:hypothetical protein
MNTTNHPKKSSAKKLKRPSNKIIISSSLLRKNRDARKISKKEHGSVKNNITFGGEVRKKKSGKSSSGKSGIPSYARILQNPFQALGCRQPDLFDNGCISFHHKSVTMLAASVATAGYVVFCNPIDTLWDCTTSTLGATGLTAFAGATNCYGAVPLANLKGDLSNFRMVSGGIKIRNNQPMNGVTGRIRVASIPVVGHLPMIGLLTNVVPLFQNIMATAFGDTAPFSQTTGVPLSNLLGVPGAVECTCEDLWQNEMNLCFRPTSMDFTSFNALTINDSFNATINQVDSWAETAATGAMVNAYSEPASLTKNYGWNAFFIEIDGASSVSGGAVELELCLHFEGTPTANVNSFTASNVIPPRPSGFSNTVEATMQALNGISQITIGEIAHNLPGMWERAFA